MEQKQDKNDEIELLHEINKSFAQLDEDAQKRILDYLRARYIANANLPEATGKIEKPWVAPKSSSRDPQRKICDWVTSIKFEDNFMVLC